MKRNKNFEKKALLLQKGGFHHHTIFKERKNLAKGNTKRKCHYLGDRKSSAHMEYDKDIARKQSDRLIERAARAARTLAKFFDLVCHTTT